MPLILTTCPTTGSAVSTQLRITPKAWESGEMEDGVFRCGECAQEHRWQRTSAWLSRPPQALEF